MFTYVFAYHTHKSALVGHGLALFLNNHRCVTGIPVSLSFSLLVPVPRLRRRPVSDKLLQLESEGASSGSVDIKN